MGPDTYFHVYLMIDLDKDTKYVDVSIQKGANWALMRLLLSPRSQDKLRKYRQKVFKYIRNKYTFAYCLMFKWYIVTDRTDMMHTFTDTVM